MMEHWYYCRAGCKSEAMRDLNLDKFSYQYQQETPVGTVQLLSGVIIYYRYR